ncbi:ATP-binding protein [Halopseudomonas pachastrellae]|nr:ATP-binding protein [Halopseudomonas pachastrellae]
MPEAMARMLEIAESNSQRLNLLINDLLDMEKLAAGKMKFDMRPYALTELIDEALNANQAFATSRDITLKREGDCHCWVRVDSMRLHQILNNYLSNAIKFSPAGSVVTVTTQRLGEQVQINVIDRGEGIRWPSSRRYSISSPKRMARIVAAGRHRAGSGDYSRASSANER